MRLQYSLLSLLFVMGLCSLPLTGLDKPKELTTEQILNELSLNNLSMMNSADLVWRQSVESRKESKQSKEALIVLKKDNDLLAMNLSEQESLVTAMTDFSVNLNNDLQTEQQNSAKKSKQIKMLLGVLIVSVAFNLFK